MNQRTPRELTPREIEVAVLIAAGRTNQEIADELYLGLGTVKKHVESVQRKVGARNRVGIATWVLRSDRNEGAQLTV